MNTPRKKKSIRTSFNNLLRAITRRRRGEISTPVSARERKTRSAFHLVEESVEPVITVPLSARGPKKTNFDELIANANPLKRRLSIDQLSRNKFNTPDFALKQVQPPHKEEQKIPIVIKRNKLLEIDASPSELKVKRLSYVIKKGKQKEETITRASSSITDLAKNNSTVTVNEDKQDILNSILTVDSDTNKTESESTLDESSTCEEDDETMSSLPPRTFNLDEYTHSMASFDDRVFSTTITQDRKIEHRVLDLACRGSLDELRSLLESNVELASCTDRDGSTPMHQAARFNRADVIEMLIQEPFYADINCKDLNDSTPLHWASVHASLDAILSLCKNGAHINIRDKYGKGPLHLAIVKRCYRGANIMLLYGADINFKRADGSTAFHIACELGDIQTIEWLVTKEKVNHNCRDKQGETPLLRAATQGKLEVVEYIMKTQLMSWNARDDKQQSLLHRAAFYGYYDLISRIAFINPAACKTMLNEPDRSGDTPLHMAVKRDHFKEVKLLCKMGSDPSMKNKNGDTPLHVAIKYKRIKIARYLYMTTKEVADIKNKRAETPRLMAKRLGPELTAIFE